MTGRHGKTSRLMVGSAALLVGSLAGSAARGEQGPASAPAGFPDAAPGALRTPALLVEGELADYVPGAGGGGLFFGGRTGGFSGGVTFGIGTRSLLVDGTEYVRNAWGWGLGLRAQLYASPDQRVSVDAAADFRAVYDVLVGVEPGTATVDPRGVTDRGYVLGAGPMVTYWPHPSFGIGYSPRVTILEAGPSTKFSLMNVVRVTVAF